MTARVLFRTAAVLIFLFAVGHTLGFRQIDPAWHIDPVITGMQSATFSAQGFQRTYWDFYAGFGLFVSVLLLFASAIAWLIGSAAPGASPMIRQLAWCLTATFAAVVALSCLYFFWLPIIFSAVICAVLLIGSVKLQRGNA